MMANIFDRHATPAYFLLAFAISWGAIILLVGPDGIPASTDQLVSLGMAMLLGPSVAGILMTVIVAGRSGFRDVLSRLFRVNVPARWYAVALFTAPVATVVTLLVVGSFSSDVVPPILTSDESANLVILAVVGGLTVGVLEEIGWTGFAVPHMRKRFGILATGLIVGTLWGGWHLILFIEENTFSGAFPVALLLARLFAWLPAYRILMVWLHDRTNSLAVTVIMHVSLVATLQLLDPALSGWDLLAFIFVRGAVLWVLALAVASKLRTPEHQSA